MSSKGTRIDQVDLFGVLDCVNAPNLNNVMSGREVMLAEIRRTSSDLNCKSLLCRRSAGPTGPIFGATSEVSDGHDEQPV